MAHDGACVRACARARVRAWHHGIVAECDGLSGIGHAMPCQQTSLLPILFLCVDRCVDMWVDMCVDMSTERSFQLLQGHTLTIVQLFAAWCIDMRSVNNPIQQVGTVCAGMYVDRCVDISTGHVLRQCLLPHPSLHLDTCAKDVPKTCV